jgi:hypothetical protein
MEAAAVSLCCAGIGEGARIDGQLQTQARRLPDQGESLAIHRSPVPDTAA